jgi:hypothetical protein
MSQSDYVWMKQRRGLKATMPTSAPDGALLLPSDTDEIYVGTGTGVKKLAGGLAGHQTKYTLYEDNVGVYADGMPGVYDPKAREGWYFTNAVTGQKISWYYYDPTVITSTVAQFQSTYAIATIDTNRFPYFAIYTAGVDFGWYKSRRVYAVANPATVTPGKYLIYTGADPGVYPELPRIQLTETASLSNGAFAPTETIMTMTLQTESGSAAGNYKFVTHQLGFKTESASRELDLKIKGEQTVTFTQAAPATTWNILHRLGKRPSVTIVDNVGNVIDGQVVYNSDIQITVYFNPAVAGKAYLN